MNSSRKKVGKRTARMLGVTDVVDKSKRIRTTLYLNAKNFKAFQKLAKSKGYSTSEIVDSMIADALDIYRK